MSFYDANEYAEVLLVSCDQDPQLNAVVLTVNHQNNRTWIVIDGWNLGSLSTHDTFSTYQNVLYFLAGRWNVPRISLQTRSKGD